MNMPNPAPAVRPSAPAVTGNPLDLKVHAAIARASSSVSPIALLLATVDWAGHLACSPGKQLELLDLGLEQTRRLLQYAREVAGATPECPAHECVEPPRRERRFEAKEWHQWPFNLMHQSFLLTQEWWQAATRGVRGVSRHHEEVVSFAARQLLDVCSPGNYLATNPTVLQRTAESGGANLARGMLHLLDDLERLASGKPPAGTEDFVVGRDLAVTPGKVVLKNRLID